MLRQLMGGALGYVRSVFPLSRQARLVGWLLPKRYWYRFALLASGLQGRLKTRFGGNGALTEALMLDNWIRALTLHGAYPIPWHPGQADVLDQVVPRHGVLYCWTHLPLVEIPLRALHEMGRPIDLIVAHPGKIVDGDEFVIPGLTTRIKVIPVDRRVLTRVRTALQQGKSVACLADYQLFGPLSPQVLQITGKVHAFVIYTWAERQPDDTLTVNFIPAPHPFCRTDQEIAENLEYLRVMNEKTLRKLNALPE